jgi:hypothetical protein
MTESPQESRAGERTPVPRQEWSRFCERFSRRHRGWLASLEVGGSLITDALPLWEVSVEPRGAGTDILVTLGAADSPMIHRVARVEAVMALRTAEGSETGLRLDPAGGPGHLLRFRPSAGTDDVLDGLAPGERL